MLKWAFHTGEYPRYIEKMHLDEPVFIQFLIFGGNVLRGDLGIDVFSERSVGETVAEQLPYTLALALASMGWAALLGIPLGCLSAVRPNTSPPFASTPLLPDICE